MSANSEPADVVAIQAKVIKALRAGKGFMTAHKEGGTQVYFDGLTYVRSDYGDGPNTHQTFASEAGVLAYLHQIYHWDARYDARPDDITELAHWQFIERKLIRHNFRPDRSPLDSWLGPAQATAAPGSSTGTTRTTGTTGTTNNTSTTRRGAWTHARAHPLRWLLGLYVTGLVVLLALARLFNSDALGWMFGLGLIFGVAALLVVLPVVLLVWAVRAWLRRRTKPGCANRERPV